jgi:hypothetical protein
VLQRRLAGCLHASPPRCTPCTAFPFLDPSIPYTARSACTNKPTQASRAESRTSAQMHRRQPPAQTHLATGVVAGAGRGPRRHQVALVAVAGVHNLNVHQAGAHAQHLQVVPRDCGTGCVERAPQGIRGGGSAATAASGSAGRAGGPSSTGCGPLAPPPRYTCPSQLHCALSHQNDSPHSTVGPTTRRARPAFPPPPQQGNTSSKLHGHSCPGAQLPSRRQAGGSAPHP